MEKQYNLFEMPEAKEGLGIVAVDFTINDPKGKLWKIKPIATGSFSEVYKAKRKIIKTAPTAA